MFIENALKSYVIETVLHDCHSENLDTIFNKSITDYKSYTPGSLSIPLSEVHAICYRSPHNPLKKSIFFKS